MTTTIQLWTGSKAHSSQLAEITTELEVVTCWCGVPVGVPSNLVRYARDHKGQNIYCPLGHTFVFRTTKDELLEAERNRRARLQAQLDQRDADLRAQKAAKTRFKNERDRLAKRASAGVCPCCNRTFQQLARHMQSKHPGFDGHPVADPAAMGGTLVSRVAAVMADGEPYTPEEIATLLGAKLSTVRQYLWDQTVPSQRVAPGVFQVAQ